MTPARGRLLLKPIETPETVPGGRILLTEQTRAELTAQQMEVFAVGEWARCDDLDCERRHVALLDAGRSHPNGIQRGNWVVVAARSLRESPGAGLYFCHQDDVLAVLEA